MPNYWVRIFAAKPIYTDLEIVAKDRADAEEKARAMVEEYGRGLYWTEGIGLQDGSIDVTDVEELPPLEEENAGEDSNDHQP